MLVPTAFGAAVGVLLAAGGGDLAPPPASWGGLAAWADERGPVTAAVALLRLGAVAAAGWVAAAATVACAARAVGAVRVTAVAERVLPVLVRQAAAGFATAGAASFVGVGAVAAQAVAPDDGEGTARMAVLADEPAPAAPPAEPEEQEEEEWVVAPGDSFWSIAEEVVAESRGRPPTDAEVDPYWRALIEANRDRLVTANPDLLHPGQTLVLPPH